MNYKIYPPDGILEAEVVLPLSKSESNRALIINALNGMETSFEVARCSDTDAVKSALTFSADEINVGNAGTAMRFLTAYFAQREGLEVILTGDERMRQRPIAPLVTALCKCGADIEYLAEDGFPPLKIKGRKLTGGDVDVDNAMSSQYVSALLMIAPYMNDGIRLHLGETEVSMPYIELTMDMMRRAGAEVERVDSVITVSAKHYDKPIGSVGGDWSAAAFWLEMVAVSSGFVTLKGLDKKSAQGDRGAMDLFCRLGVAIEEEPENADDIELCGSPDVAPRLNLDMTAMPDLVQPLVVACAMIGVPFTLCGVTNLRIKETDRLEALRRELMKIGVEMEVEKDVISWSGRRMPIAEMPEFDTYGDHRMAMAFTPVSLYIPGIVIRDAQVVGKSYPEYWEHLRQAGFEIVDAEDSENEEGEQ